MAIYSVTYDLNKSVKDYEGLFAELESCTAYIKYQQSAWLVKSEESCESLYNRLRAITDDNDSLFVIEVKSNYYGWLQKEYWEYVDSLLS